MTFQIETAAAHLAAFAKVAIREGQTDEDAIMTRAIELSEGFAKFAAHILSSPKRLAAYKAFLCPLVWLDAQKQAQTEAATRGAMALAEAW
jgi:hypothetical protein